MTDIRTRFPSAIADRYRIERELGQGGMATVYGDAGADMMALGGA